MAAANTRANLETCAILAGRLIQGAFLVTTLLIPKQVGSDAWLVLSCMLML